MALARAPRKPSWAPSSAGVRGYRGGARRRYQLAIPGVYSSNVQRVLDAPLLETPEGMTPARQVAIVEAFWKAMKNENNVRGGRRAPPAVVGSRPGESWLAGRAPAEFDVCICGGILGIMLGLSLLVKGEHDADTDGQEVRVCIVEKRAVEGRKQEWNISKHDIYVLSRLGMLTPAEIESCIVTRWEQDRIAFKGEADDMWLEGALDLGVDPRRLIAMLRDKFVERGGTILEHHMFHKANVYDDAVRVELKGFNVSSESEDWNAGDMNRGASDESDEDGGSRDGQTDKRSSLSCRLLVDCMGHYSPIVKQQRQGQPVEGMVIVVGGCMTEDDTKTNKDLSADLLITIDDSENDMQYFWEAFPAEGGKAKTVYMFAYTDADPARPSMVDIFDTYLSNLERYQGVPLDEINWKRILLGGFPCYSKHVPLRPSFDRIIQAGDASAVQSPLSFGGFASMCRHLPRLQRGIAHALKADRLKKNDLALINPYLPNLAVAWLFQRAMSLKIGQGSKSYISTNHINRLMMCNFRVMKFFGPSVTLPFVQDSFQALPLGLVMVGMMLKDPVTITKVIFQVGLGLVMRWMAHYMCLVVYTVLHAIVRASGIDRLITGYRAQRFFDALKWGSGLDDDTDVVDGIDDREQRSEAGGGFAAAMP